MTKLEDMKMLLKNHENRIAKLESKQKPIARLTTKSWYNAGSTVEKILSLLDTGFFNSPRTIADIIEELKSKDFHFKASDLTLPLRKIVRKGVLDKTKKKTDGTVSSRWMYKKK